MRNNTSVIYNVCLLIGDAIALIGGLSIAYILRVSISHEVLSAHVTAANYLKFLLILTPFWLFVFAILGLYTERYYQNRFREAGRLATGTFIGVLFAIGYSYMINEPIFPARLVVIYGFIFSFVAVLIFRTLARQLQKQLFRLGKGLNNVLLVGDTKTTAVLTSTLNDKITGYKIIGIVGCKKHTNVATNGYHCYDSFNEAIAGLKDRQLHTIIQTELYSDTESNDEILTYAQSKHIAFRFVPGNSELFVGNISVDLLQSMPIIAVHQTALVGWGKVVKRLTDIILSTVLITISSPLWLLIILAEKISSPTTSVLYKVKRLSRYGTTVTIYKFRSFRPGYNMSPEEGFAKMGRLDLLKKFRENGDYLENDPRITRLGKFIRKTSLDELPQLFNVLKGDISLVGPRALDVHELEHYSKKNLILAVKSGLTGLAQISGRKEISWDERRRIDLYYVQNWSFWGDLVILAKTIWVVLFHQGAI